MNQFVSYFFRTLAVVACCCTTALAQNSMTTSFKMKIADVFEIKGRGVVVTGTIQSGAVAVGDILVLRRQGRPELKVKVVDIEKFQQENLKSAAAGSDDVGLQLADIVRSDVNSGDALVGDTKGAT